jgi:hypothetical protein
LQKVLESLRDFFWKFFVHLPHNPRSFNHFVQIRPDILDPHPKDTVDLFGVDRKSVIFGHASGNNKISHATVRFKFEGYFGVNFAMNVSSSFLIDLAGSALVNPFVLIELAFGEAQLIPDSDNENFGSFFVEDDGSADRFIFLDPKNEFPRVNPNARRGVLGQFCQELISFLLPFLRSADSQYFIKIVVKGFFGLVGQSGGVLQLGRRQVDDKLGENRLEQLLLLLSRVIHNLTNIMDEPANLFSILTLTVFIFHYIFQS